MIYFYRLYVLTYLHKYVKTMLNQNDFQISSIYRLFYFERLATFKQRRPEDNI